nr:CHAT domain-containing protein [Oculatella sp. LEGE 06141]
MTARGIAQHRGEVLRLRLGLKGLSLPRLPWEVLHGGASTTDKLRQRDALGPAPRPIAAGTDIVFSRYQLSTGLVPIGSQVAIEPEQSLRILMVIAAPTDQERLDLRREASQLQQELRRQSAALPEGMASSVPDIQLTILDQPGREQLTQALEQGRYHVLHYAGHSNLGAAGGNLYLVNNKTGLTEILNGDDLAGLLVNNGVRMVVFNSCRGAYTAASDPSVEEERNLAEALVSRGIPAVLAMAEQIPDDVALTLTRLFYRNLKQGYPIDLSLSRARQGLISAYGSNQLYWALPILYLHPEFDGYLTMGDRTLDNPADRLLLLPQVYDASPVLSGEEDTYANAAALDGDDWIELSEAVLAEDDLGALVDDVEYYDEFSDAFNDDESLSYDDDAVVVSDLIQQLSYPAPPPTGLPSTAASDLGLNNQRAAEAEKPSSYSADGATSRPSAEKTTTKVPATVSQMATQPNSVAPSAAQPNWQLAPAGAALALHRSVWQPIVNHPRLIPLLGIVGVAAIAVLGFSLLSRLPRNPTPEQLLRGAELPGIDSTVPNRSADNVDLATASTSDVTRIAISQLNQPDLTDGQKAVSALLDRGALREAKAAIGSIDSNQRDQPIVSFLLGRLAWQSVQVGDTDYSFDDARRYWETATRVRSPSPRHYNALGFAYYNEGRSRDATQAWYQALALLEVQAANQTASDTANAEESNAEQMTMDKDTLTAYAGIALVLYQEALAGASGDRTPTEQRDVQSKAVKLYQMVMENDPVGFSIEGLSRPENWLWTEQAISEWQALGAAQP